MFLASDSYDDHPPAQPSAPPVLAGRALPAPPTHRSTAKRGIDGQAERVLERLLELERRALGGDPPDVAAIEEASLDVQDLQLAIMGATHGWEHPADQRALRDAGLSIALAAAATVDLLERVTRG